MLMCYIHITVYNMCKYVHICMYTYKHTHISLSIHVLYVYVCIYTYVYIYICIGTVHFPAVYGCSFCKEIQHASQEAYACKNSKPQGLE